MVIMWVTIDNCCESMKRSTTIGFDARYAVTDHERYGAYCRMVIGAMARATSRYGYYRAYVANYNPHKEYTKIEQLHNVETMVPDGELWRTLRLPWRLWWINNDLSNGDVELYHGLAEHIPFGLAQSNIRSVVTIHDMAFLYDKSISGAIYNIVKRLYISQLLHRVDRIVAVSECVKRDIVSQFIIDPDKVDIVYGGVAGRYAERVDDDVKAEVRERYILPQKYVLSVGEQHERRNMAQLIKILPLLDHELHYVIVGRATSHTSRLLRAAKELGVSDRVHILYKVDECDMPAIYQSAAMLLNLSSYEGYASSVAEAMASGIPVIATRSSCMEEIAEDAAIYVHADNRDELLSAVHRVLEDEEVRSQMIRLGRRLVSRFREEVVAYNLLNCYRRVGVDVRG